MGSEPQTKRQRLAPSPATPSTSVPRPLAGSTTSSLPQQSALDQNLFHYEPQQHERLYSAEFRSSAPPDPLPPAASAPQGLKSTRRYHNHGPYKPIDQGNQPHDHGHITPAERASYLSSYVFGMEHVSTRPEPTMTPASNAPLAFSFQVPDQTPLHPNHTDTQLLHSSYYNDLPVLSNSNDAHLLMPSTPLSAQSYEEKQGHTSSESVPNDTSASERPLKRKSTKASRVNLSIEKLVYHVSTD